MPSDDQINSYLERLNEARQAYEHDHPNWRVESLYWILERGLGGLQKLLKSNIVSWRDPFVELRFPVECQWTGATDSAPFVVASNIKRSDFADDDAAVKSLTKLMVSQMEIETLQRLTNDAVYVREGKTCRTMFSAEDVERLLAIASPDERDRQMRELLRAFSFGGGTIDAPQESGDGAPISETTAMQLAAINPPLLILPAPDGVEAGKVAVIFQVAPMIAIPAERTAYFPLVVGLTFFPDKTGGGSGEAPAPGWLRFADWSEQHRDILWHSLFAAITQHLSQLGTATTTEFKAAVLTVNSQIQVTQRSNESLDELRQRALAGLQQAGTVISYHSEMQAEGIGALPAEIQAALESVEAAQTSQDKGESLEHLLQLLFSTIQGFRVSNRVRTETEEIDLVIVSSGNVSEFRAEGPIILVECKNWSGPCGKNEFVQFLDKMRNRSERCTLGFLVSWKGFAGTITKEMLRSSRDKLLVVPLSGDEIKEAVRKGSFRDLLIDAWENALRV